LYINYIQVNQYKLKKFKILRHFKLKNRRKLLIILKILLPLEE